MSAFSYPGHHFGCELPTCSNCGCEALPAVLCVFRTEAVLGVQWGEGVINQQPDWTCEIQFSQYRSRNWRRSGHCEWEGQLCSPHKIWIWGCNRLEDQDMREGRSFFWPLQPGVVSGQYRLVDLKGWIPGDWTIGHQRIGEWDPLIED